MSGTIATDSNLSATGTITLSFANAPLAPTRYASTNDRTAPVISSLAAGTYLFSVTIATNDSHSSSITASISGASTVVAFPIMAVPGSGSPELGQTLNGIYSVSSTGNVTLSLSSYSGIDTILFTATPVTT